MDYVLTFEKLVSEYEKISSTKYDDNFKIGTLLKGIPQNRKQHIMVDISEKTTYAELRTKLLPYERSNQTWSAENILGSLSVQAPTSQSSKEYHGPIPMELDRIHYRKGKGDKGKGDKGKSRKGKGDKGKGHYGRGRGYGKGKGGRKGKGRGYGKGKGGKSGKGKGGGKSVRQVEGKGYGDGNGKGGQGVVCYNCGKTGHIASECWRIWSNEGQQSSSSAAQAKAAPAAKGNEQVRRLISAPMPIIEEVEEDEDYIDLVGMFEEAAQNWALRMVKSVEVQSEEEVKKSEVVLAHLADTEEEDDEEYKEDELLVV